MRRIDDDYIARMMCCGGKCEVGVNTGLCHRWDFTAEVAKVRALLDNQRLAIDALMNDPCQSNAPNSDNAPIAYSQTIPETGRQ